MVEITVVQELLNDIFERRVHKIQLKKERKKKKQILI